MSSKSVSQFHCTDCKQMRLFSFDLVDHEKKIAKSPNGLASYAEIHRCSDGLLCIYDLQIDANKAIRSFNQMKLPVHRRPSQMAIPGIPAPQVKSGEKRLTFNISEMLPDGGFRIVIYDDMINVLINIGEVDIESEIKLATLQSDHGTITLDYYYSEVAYTNKIEKLLFTLVNTIEIVPPIKIGLFLETLRYIHNIQLEDPTAFHTKLLRTILTTHETHFIIEDDVDIKSSLKDLRYKYGDEVADFAKHLIGHIISDPFTSLQKFMTLEKEQSKHDDLIYVIHTLMLMEQTGMFIIDRPGIVEESYSEPL